MRRVFYNLRQLLPACLHIERRTAQFLPSALCQVDVLAFRKLLQADTSPEALDAALQWFRGPLLEGLALEKCPEFELWLTIERERWQQQVAGVLEAAIERDTRLGNYARALTYVDHVLTLTPWSEVAHRQKMLLLARTGQRSAALRQYDMCQRLLREELDVVPLPETTALYDRLRAAGTRARHQLPMPAHPVPFVGREAELAQIGLHMADPDCRLLTLVGMGGVGKTRLALRAARAYSDTFLDGVAFVPLVGIPEAAQLPNAIADALQLSLRGVKDVQTHLLDYVHDKELLLVLDNFEQLVEGARKLATFLGAAPFITLLVTSRARLNLRWEWVFP